MHHRYFKSFFFSFLFFSIRLSYNRKSRFPLWIFQQKKVSIINGILRKGKTKLCLIFYWKFKHIVKNYFNDFWSFIWENAHNLIKLVYVPFLKANDFIISLISVKLTSLLSKEQWSVHSFFFLCRIHYTIYFINGF